MDGTHTPVSNSSIVEIRDIAMLCIYPRLSAEKKQHSGVLATPTIPHPFSAVPRVVISPTDKVPVMGRGGGGGGGGEMKKKWIGMGKKVWGSNSHLLIIALEHWLMTETRTIPTYCDGIMCKQGFPQCFGAHLKPCQFKL